MRCPKCGMCVMAKKSKQHIEKHGECWSCHNGKKRNCLGRHHTGNVDRLQIEVKAG